MPEIIIVTSILCAYFTHSCVKIPVDFRYQKGFFYFTSLVKLNILQKNSTSCMTLHFICLDFKYLISLAIIKTEQVFQSPNQAPVFPYLASCCAGGVPKSM